MAVVRAIHTLMFPDRVYPPGEVIETTAEIAARLVLLGAATLLAEPEPEPATVTEPAPVAAPVADRGCPNGEPGEPGEPGIPAPRLQETKRMKQRR